MRLAGHRGQILECKIFPIFIPKSAEDRFIKAYTHIVGTDFYPCSRMGKRNGFESLDEATALLVRAQMGFFGIGAFLIRLTLQEQITVNSEKCETAKNK